jgi:ribosomal protein S18 acetylase RimI-like enzyme
MTNIRRLGKDEKIPYDLLLLADENVEAINKYIFDCEIYVLEQENKIIAEYAFQQIDESEAEIKNIALTPEVQGKGIGKTLVRDAADRAKARGFKTITIGTGDASTKQLHLYQEEGFKMAIARINFFVNNYLRPIFENEKELKDMIVLRKELR